MPAVLRENLGASRDRCYERGEWFSVRSLTLAATKLPPEVTRLNQITLARAGTGSHATGFMSEDPSLSSPPEAPWHAGLRAARANLLPGFLLQAVALALVLAYYWHPPTRALFEQLITLRQRTGMLFSIVATSLCGGVLPFIYMRSQPETGSRFTWASGLFFTLFWAYKGVEVDLWQRALAHFIGNDTRVTTVALKVFMDQIVYCPIWAVVVTVIAYNWQSAGFRWAPLVADFQAGHWYQRQILPALVANLGLWVPLTVLIFALPLPLQLPLFDLALVFYTLLIAHITRRKI